MALSRVGGSSVAATSVTIPAHIAGDLIVIWAYRDGNTTPPTVPTAGGTVPTFTVIDNPTGANACSAVCAYAVAAGTTDTSGTWTNATGISVEVWRGQSSAPIGGHAQSGASVASGGNLAVPAITQQDTTGNSVLLAFAGWQTVTAWSAAPTGYTQRSNVSTECEALTKNSTTSDGTFNVSGTASGSGGTRTQQVEILADVGNRVSQTAAEVLYKTSAALARASQIAAEILYATAAANARVSQTAVEAVIKVPALGNRVSQSSVEVVMVIPAGINAPSGVITVKADGASLTNFPDSGGVFALKGDTPYVTPIACSSGTINAKGDSPGLLLVAQIPSGLVKLAGDIPTLPAAGPPPPSGIVRLAGVGPNVLTEQASSGVVKLGANASTSTLVQTVGGSVAMRGDSPTVYPLSTPSGVITFKGDGPGLQTDFIIRLTSSGVIILAGSRPTVIPTPGGSGGGTPAGTAKHVQAVV